MTAILRDEITRTEAVLDAARRDSRLGSAWEEEYMYWLQTIEAKLALLRSDAQKQIPEYQTQHGLE
jgi:hypothetical protein